MVSVTHAPIVVEGLVIRYGARAVVDGVSFVVRPGEIVALLGPNGAGKSSTVEAIEGYRRPTAGSVRVLGEDPRQGGPALRARVGVMLQEGGLEPRSTPRDLVRLAARLHTDPEDPDRLIASLGLADVAGTRVRRLSGGERQRLAFALALVGRPEVLILDEPTAGMDPAATRALRARIAELRSAGVAILLTTHDLGDVERLADRVLILRDGRIVAEGPPATVGAEGGSSGDSSRRAATQLFRFDRPLGTAEVAALRSWAGERGLGIAADDHDGEASLEERYLALTEDRNVEHVP